MPDIVIDLSTIQQADILGLLMIYKYIDYTHTNSCFKKPNIKIDNYITDIWKKYEFDNLIKSYISNKEVTDRQFKDFKVKLNDKFIIAPQALLRNSNYTNDYLKQEFIPKIEQYYEKASKSSDVIFSCFSEILLNFWEHAVSDTKSVIIADGNNSKIEIACADSGVGIISNLEVVYGKNKKDNMLLSRALEKGVTSKPNTNHMGFGLWLVNELVNANRGKLHLYSQGYYYYNEYGKIKTGECAYWPGTVIYVNLNLNNPKTISDILSPTINNKLKINFT